MTFRRVYNDIMALDENNSLEECRSRYLTLTELLLHDDDDLYHETVDALTRCVSPEFYTEVIPCRKCSQESGPSGIIKHTARGAKVAFQLLHLFNLEHQEAMEMWSALLLHDSFKNFNPDKGCWIPGHSRRDHAKIAAAELEKFFIAEIKSTSNYPDDLRASIKNVIYDISIHSNRFEAEGAKNVKEMSPSAQILVISDYYVSQCGINL